MGSENIKYNMVSARPIDMSMDYATLCMWWSKYGSRSPRPQHYSKTGFMVEVEGQQICAGFLYRTDATICLFEFMVCNPDASKDKRKIALEYLIETIKEKAKELGYDLIYISIASKPFIKKLENAGFITLERNQVHMLCEV